MVKPTTRFTSKTNVLKPLIWAGSFFLVVSLLFMAKPPVKKPVVYDEDGDVVLAPHRKAKLAKKLEELEEAEQYALLAIVNGWYPCFSCPDSDVIYLNKGEVWKYGHSKKGKKRYPASFYKAMRLEYITQLIGPIEECMKAELTKIINYPTLPEARTRLVVLERPPGNKIDF